MITKGKQMTALINPQAPNSEKEKVDTIFNSVEESMGVLPDALKLYGVSPTLLENFVGSVGYFMGHSELSQELLAMIRYLVSSDANCPFCIDLNTSRLINNLGKTVEQLQATREDINNAPLSPAEIVLLKIAITSIDNPDAITQDDMQKAYNAGFNDRNIFDAVVMAANNKALTYVLKTFNVDHQGAFS
jgi:alkylhydroperoxidase family enzyme